MATASKDHWSASNYSAHASFVPKLGSIILEMLDAKPDERILDLGCGDGVLTVELAKKCKSVVGIDASKAMIDKAKQEYLGDGNIEYYVADGQNLAPWFDETGQQAFDAVFSNAALHWMKEPVKVIQSIYHVLKPKGRFVAEFGAFLNCADVHNALISALNHRGFDGKAISPWYFPSTEAYSKLLREKGFEVAEIQAVPRPTQLPSDIAGWIRTFGFNFLEVLKTEAEREQMVQEVVENLRPGCQREDGTWFIMYVRMRLIAYKE